MVQPFSDFEKDWLIYSAVSFPGIYLAKIKTYTHIKKTCIQILTTALFIMAKK